MLRRQTVNLKYLLTFSLLGNEEEEEVKKINNEQIMTRIF